jgi:hypothetical protein
MKHRALPLLTLVALLLGWEALVRIAQIPHYTLPAPSLVLQTLAANFGSLAGSWWFTLKITFGALALACTGGVLIASVFALSRTAEAALFPIAVVLQVTPIVAIAPLILIYVESTTAALLLCAWIVAFFPILSNTVIGLRAADPNLRDLFRLYRATPWQRLRLLRRAQRAAVLRGRPEGVGRAEPDRRRHRRDGGRRGGPRDRAGLAHPRGELSHRDAEDVRRAAAARAHRRGDLLRLSRRCRAGCSVGGMLASNSTEDAP